MTMEEQYRQEIWGILQEIKKESDASATLDYLKLHIPPDKKAKWTTALEILEKQGAIKIEAKITYDRISINNIDLFEENYKKFEKLCSNISLLLQDCRQLIENILSESQPEHKYILAVVAKADHQGIIRQPDSLFPNFYGYTMDQTKMNLMTNLHITSNVPGGGLPSAEHGLKIMTSYHLTLCEHRLNIHYVRKSIDDLINELAMSEWAWTTNTSAYQDAEVILVFRDEAMEFIKKLEMPLRDTTEVSWFVLKAIKKELELTTKGENVKVDFLHLTNKTSPSLKEVSKYIRKLQQEEILKIVENETHSEDEKYGYDFNWDNANRFSFNINKQKFYELYQSKQDQNIKYSQPIQSLQEPQTEPPQFVKKEKHEQFNDWPEKFHWIDDKQFYLDEGKKISFSSSNSYRIQVFKALIEAKGQFVNVSTIVKTIYGKNNNKNNHKVRVIIGQLNREKCKKHNIIEIVPLDDTDSGAYKIRQLDLYS